MLACRNIDRLWDQICDLSAAEDVSNHEATLLPSCRFVFSH